MVKDLVRPELQKLVPYVSHQVPYRIKLDANESPFELPESIRKKLADYFLKGPGLNIYPDNESVELRKTIANTGMLMRMRLSWVPVPTSLFS